MRVFVAFTALITLFYLMTGIVYAEGDFSGVFVVKPYPMRQVGFGGGEEGTWARRHPGQPLPWFMQKDLRVIHRFSWEEGRPRWITVYVASYLALHLVWVALPVAGTVRLLKRRARS